VKERLTGAIILVALMVLLVPELLTGPVRPKPARAASATAASAGSSAAPAAGSAPAHAEPPLRTYTLTLGGASPARDAVAPPAAHDTVAAPAAQAAPQPTEGPPQGAAENSTPGPRAAAQAGSALQAGKPAAHPVVAEARSAAATGGWVVQLGSFASRQNADRLARSLEGRGFRMSVSPARAGARVLWRVRAGPAHDRAAAGHLAARLQALGHRGELLPVR